MQKELLDTVSLCECTVSGSLLFSAGYCNLLAGESRQVSQLLTDVPRRQDLNLDGRV